MHPSLYQLRAFQAGCLIARLLPRSVVQRIAVRIGQTCYRRNPSVQAALQANLRIASGLTNGAVEALGLKNVGFFSRMLADYFYCASHGSEKAGALLHEWHGIEHFEGARARGKGVVLVTAHLGNWELGGVLLALRGLPLTVVTLEEPSSELTRWRDRCRQRLGIKTIAVGPGHDFAFVEMLQTLRRNEILAMLVDRPYSGTGAPVRFFDRDTEFSAAPALLWEHTEAAVVPAFVLQECGGQYISFADSPLSFRHGSDARAAQIANTQILATHFETIIRQHPEQWFNYVPIWGK